MHIILIQLPINDEAKDFFAEAKTDENVLYSDYCKLTALQSYIVLLAITTAGSVVITILIKMINFLK